MSVFVPEIHSTGPAAVQDALPTVLVIEDDPALHKLLLEALSEDYRTLSAMDGEQGLQLARTQGPDLVVLDVGLPRMDGRAVLAALRQHGELSDVPVLIVTGLHDRGRNLDLLREGAQDLLLKPFSLSELEVRVRNLVQTKTTLDTLNAIIGRHETDMVKLARQVREQQLELQRTLDELRRARGVAERANRTKGNFLRMMSHELKTPVAALQLHMRLIEKGAEGSAELQDGIVRMDRSSRRLLHLVDTFLQWSRAHQERTAVSPAEVSLGALARDVANEMTAYAAQKGLKIRVRTEALQDLRTDPKIVRLLLVHLVYRAVQVSRAGTIVLEVTSSQGGAPAGRQQISVHDTSAPLTRAQASETLDVLEDPSDLASRAGSGSGLGLGVVRDIASRVGGELACCPDVRDGNVWTLTLSPLERDHEVHQGLTGVA